MHQRTNVPSNHGKYKCILDAYSVFNSTTIAQEPFSFLKLFDFYKVKPNVLIAYM
jgi:hypothetical protein